MWYKIDFTKLVIQLLPPMLRSKLLLAVIGAMIAPLRYLYGKFFTLKKNVDNRLNITGNVQYLEKALNDAFYLNDGQINIETSDVEIPPSYYFISENQKANIMHYSSEGEGFVLRMQGESGIKVNFTIKIPTFLCTSLASKEDDKYQWKYLTTIKNIINIYKPAGRTFCIELYDYE